MGDNTLKFEIDRDITENYFDLFGGGSYSQMDTAEILDTLIHSCFNWSNTLEGHPFWSYVYERLVEISNVKEENKEDKDDDEEIKITIDGTEYIARLA